MPNLKKHKYRPYYFLLPALIFEILFCGIAWEILKIVGFFSAPNSVNNEFVFLHLEYAWYLLFVPLLILIFVLQVFLRNKKINKWKDNPVFSTILRPVSTKNLFIKYFLVRNIIVFAVLALMQPAYGKKTIHATSNGVEVIFAVDLSRSMNTRDIQGKVSRLTVAKRAMIQIVNHADISKIGLVIFAGNAYTQLPLTADKTIAKMYINELQTNFISNQGTDVGAALLTSSYLFSSDRIGKVAVLITDGEDHEGNLKEGYQALKEKEVKTLVLGVGTTNGGIVPKSNAPNSKYLKNALGQTVISKVNKEMLHKITAHLNGEMMLTSAPFPNVSEFLTEINNTSSKNTVNLDFQVKANSYRWPLMIALLCLMGLFVWEISFRKVEVR